MTVLSFGFKHGIPVDADLTLDVRFLPNPHWIPELRPHSGQDAPVADYVLAQPEAGAFLDRLAAVTPEAVQAAADRWLRPQSRAAVVYRAAEQEAA